MIRKNERHTVRGNKPKHTKRNTEESKHAERKGKKTTAEVREHRPQS